MAAPAWASEPPGLMLDSPSGNATTNAPAGGGITWQMVGPGAGGAFNQIVETMDGVVLAGGDVGGLFRSLNRGGSWLALGKLNTASGTGAASSIFDRTNVSALAYDTRTDSSVVYAGIEGGLLRAISGARTFQSRTCDSTSGNDWIASIAVPHWHPDTVLVAWHRTFSDTIGGCIRYNTTRGIVDSTYATQPSLWRRVTTNGLPTQGLRLIKVGCKPNNAQFMYALSGTDGQIEDKLCTAGTQFRLWRRRGGAGNMLSGAWVDVSPGGAADSVFDFLIHPDNPDTVFATTFTGSISAGTWTGQTWVKVNQDSAWRPISAHTGALLCAKRGGGLEPLIFTIDVQRDYAPGCAECGVWKSPNAAALSAGGAPIADGNFARVNTGNFGTGWQFMPKWAYGRSERGVANTVSTSGADSTTFYWGSSEYVFRADTTGAFDQIYTDLKRSGPAAGNDFWLGRQIGNTIPVAASAAPGITAIGWYDLGIGLSKDGGLTWQMVNDSTMTDPGSEQRPSPCGNCGGGWLGHGGDCSAILIDPAKPSRIWAGQGTGKTAQRIIRSANFGAPASWDSTIGLPAGVNSGSFLYALALDKSSPVGNRKLFVCSNGDLFRSADDGLNWSKVWDRATVQDSGLCAVGVQGNTVLIGGANGLWRATDGGADSSTYTKVFPMPGAWAIQTSGSRYDVRHRGIHDIQWGATNEVFVTISGSSSSTAGQESFVNAAGDSFGTYRSTDAGVTWAKVHAGGASGIGCYEDHFHVAKDGSWWVGSRSVGAGGGITRGNGIMCSRNRGASWTNVSANMPWPSVGAIVSDPVDAAWIIATALGPGAFRAQLPGLWAPSREGGSAP